jgi:hypothetical protein
MEKYYAMFWFNKVQERSYKEDCRDWTIIKEFLNKLKNKLTFFLSQKAKSEPHG